MQNGQRVALMATSEKQCGHSFVVGSAGASSSTFWSFEICRMRRNTQKAMIRKLTIVRMKTPQFRVTAPASWASTSVA